MLWPERREKDPVIGSKVPFPSKIDRTDAKSWIEIPKSFQPNLLVGLLNLGKLLFPWAVDQNGGLKIGPLPKGMPIGLLTNLDLDPGDGTLAQRLHRDELFAELAKHAKTDFKNAQNLSDDQLQSAFNNLTDTLLKLSKCPDLIVNRGHYFGTDMLDSKENEPGLSDSDKNALIAFLKTF
jgi:hypothetical protein